MAPLRGRPNAAPGENLLRRLGRPGTTRVWGGTFHAIATRLLRLHGRSIGLDPSFTVHDRGDSEDLMSVVRTDLGLAKTDRRFPHKGTCMDIYSRCVNARETLDEAVEVHFPWCKDGWTTCGNSLRLRRPQGASRACSTTTTCCCSGTPCWPTAAPARSIRGRFDCVLVDEYQDTNVLQAEIL